MLGAIVVLLKHDDVLEAPGHVLRDALARFRITHVACRTRDLVGHAASLLSRLSRLTELHRAEVAVVCAEHRLGDGCAVGLAADQDVALVARGAEVVGTAIDAIAGICGAVIAVVALFVTDAAAFDWHGHATGAWIAGGHMTLGLFADDHFGHAAVPCCRVAGTDVTRIGGTGDVAGVRAEVVQPARLDSAKIFVDALFVDHAATGNHVRLAQGDGEIVLNALAGVLSAGQLVIHGAYGARQRRVFATGCRIAGISSADVPVGAVDGLVNARFGCITSVDGAGVRIVAKSFAVVSARAWQIAMLQMRLERLLADGDRVPVGRIAGRDVADLYLGCGGRCRRAGQRRVSTHEESYRYNGGQGYAHAKHTGAAK